MDFLKNKVDECLFSGKSLTQKFNNADQSDCLFTFDKNSPKKKQKITDNSKCLFSSCVFKKEKQSVKTKIKKEIGELCLFSI